ncbi:hypothetical protein [Micromonospora sp. KLBMP9576]
MNGGEAGQRVAEERSDLPGEGEIAAAAAVNDNDPVHLFVGSWMGAA